MTRVLDLAVPIIIGAGLLAILYFMWQAKDARSRSSREAYGVGQQDARKVMHLSLLRSVVTLFIMMILVGVARLDIWPAEALPTEPTAEPAATLIPATVPPTASALPTVSAPTATSTNAPSTLPAVTPSPKPSLTSVPTDTPIPLPTDTPTPSPKTATVISPAGVWLRAAPSVEAEQVEWLFNGTVVILLEGFADVDDIDWQQVQTLAGDEGWVAALYILDNSENTP